MKDLYKKILEKPEAYRRRLALVITGVVGVVIFSVWLGMTYDVMQNILESSEDKTKTELAPQKRGEAPSLEERFKEKQTDSVDPYEGTYQENELNNYNNLDSQENKIETKEELKEEIYKPNY